ncbi:hypothetical protein WDL1P1_00889 (plasmid) [Variovorax sp. WDL1]|nr:hypothetical protein CHC06_05545 [Variovorax sp. B2]PNG50836.1 hypothetical protein CHC07_05450 [Variovorax sp. B4]VTV18068.1 hypothetical protein WDL1P1_00889 [Variovorax sp. WDL1]
MHALSFAGHSLRPRGAPVAPSPPPPPPPPRRYTLSDQFFKGCIDRAIQAAIFGPVTLGEKQVVKMKPSFDTACWVHLPPHRIYIGTDLFEKDMVKPKLSSELQEKYIANHYHHERAHALYTIRDLTVPKKTLAKMKAPFSLWNLFEDAYIEDRYRREASYQFEWRLMEDGDFNSRPESVLFALIQREGALDDVTADLDAWTYNAKKAGRPDGPIAIDATGLRLEPDVKSALKVWLPKVALFYARAVAVSGSMDLMPIIKAWIAEFGLPPERPPGSGQFPGISSDLQLGQGLQASPEALAEFDKDAKPMMGGETPRGSGGKGTEAEDDASKDVPVSQKGTVLGDAEHYVDPSRVDAVFQKLRKFFESKSRHVSTLTPQRRVSARHFAVGRAPYRKVELQGRAKKKIVIVVDCSGSMGMNDGLHINEARILVAALSELARKGLLSGHVVLTGVEKGPIHETYELPMQVETTSRIGAEFGAEGLEAAIRANMKLCKEADYVFVYTDGHITDHRIKKSELHAQGVYTWGLYAGFDQSLLAGLLAYFDKAVLRTCAEDLVDAMLAQTK